MDAHKKAEEWYERAAKPCIKEMRQDICALYNDEDTQWKEIMTMAFFYGYIHALEDNGLLT